MQTNGAQHHPGGSMGECAFVPPPSEGRDLHRGPDCAHFAQQCLLSPTALRPKTGRASDQVDDRQASRPLGPLEPKRVERLGRGENKSNQMDDWRHLGPRIRSEICRRARAESWPLWAGPSLWPPLVSGHHQQRAALSFCLWGATLLRPLLLLLFCS